MIGEGNIIDTIEEAGNPAEQQRGEHLIELQRVLRVHLPLVRRKKLIEDLSAVAWADNEIHAEERESLYWLAGGLEIDQSSSTRPSLAPIAPSTDPTHR